MKPGRVEGKSVIIAGAAKGIGRASAEVFARQGARLPLNDIDEPGLRQAAASLGDGVEGRDRAESSGPAPKNGTRSWRSTAPGCSSPASFAVEAMGAEDSSIVCLSSISGLAGQSSQAAYGPPISSPPA